MTSGGVGFIAIDTDSLFLMSQMMQEAWQDFDDAAGTLGTQASEFSGKVGVDQYNQSFAHSFDQATGASGDDGLSQVVGKISQGLSSLYHRTAQMAVNHANADAATGLNPSNIRSNPAAPVCRPGFAIPSVSGGDSQEPSGWSLLRKFIPDLVFPQARSEELRRVGDIIGEMKDALGQAKELVDGARNLITSGGIHVPVTDNMTAEYSAVSDSIGKAMELATRAQQMAVKHAEDIDNTHREIVDALKEFAISTMIIEAAGLFLSIISAGASEVAAQGAEASRIASAALKVRSILGTLGRAISITANIGNKAVPFGVEAVAKLGPTLSREASVAAIEVAGKESVQAAKEELTEREAGEFASTAEEAQAGRFASIFSKYGAPMKMFERYKPYLGKTPEEFRQEYGEFGNPDNPVKWPAKDGFKGEIISSDRFPPGTKLDRFGKESGSFMGTQGDSVASRSMHPDTIVNPENDKPLYSRYEPTGESISKASEGKGWVLKYGEAAPAFGQPGGATQWVIVDSEGKGVPIEELVDSGVLRRVE